MRALVKKKAQRGIWMDDIEVPQVGPNDVLIKVIRTAICGTDIHIFQWNDWARNTISVPLAIGHEFFGEIVECGSDHARTCSQIRLHRLSWPQRLLFSICLNATARCGRHCMTMHLISATR